jgi:hypothetical protein
MLPSCGRQPNTTASPWPQQQHWLHHQQQLHTSTGVWGVKAPRQPPLTDQQQHDLTAAVLSSFKQDASTASDVLARVLSDTAKRQLLSALEQLRERPELSRCGVCVLHLQDAASLDRRAERCATTLDVVSCRASMVDEPSDSAGSSTGGAPAADAGAGASDAPAAAAAPSRAAAAAGETARRESAAAAVGHAAGQQAAGQQAPAAVPEPSFKQLLRVGVTKGLPFVAFGFFDNVIVGDDVTCGGQSGARVHQQHSAAACLPCACQQHVTGVGQQPVA